MAQLLACPECAKHLQVPEELLGKKVQCPECKHNFIAALPEVEIAPVPKARPEPPTSKTPSWEQKKQDDEDDDKSDRRQRRDQDDDDRPRRRRAPRYAPHRGGMILAFGIIGLVTLIPIFGILAWIMGNSDMRAIREGRMDPEGESMTNVGRILGIIGTILAVLGILSFCGFFGCVFMFGAMGAANANRNFRQQRRF
jgi:hypothetical protein